MAGVVRRAENGASKGGKTGPGVTSAAESVGNPSAAEAAQAGVAQSGEFLCRTTRDASGVSVRSAEVPAGLGVRGAEMAVSSENTEGSARRPRPSLRLSSPGTRAQWVRICHAVLGGAGTGTRRSRPYALPPRYPASVFDDPNSLAAAFAEADAATLRTGLRRP